MTPYAWIHVEICIMVFLTVRVVPKIEGHGRLRGFTNEFAEAVDYRFARFIVTLALHRQSPTLQFTGVDGLNRAADGKASIDISTPGYGVEVQVTLDSIIDVFESLIGQD